jgi:DNA-binding LytR/AlgR family response regulator
MPKILIADDEQAPRAQMAAALAVVWPDAQLVAQCANGVDAWDSFLEHEPDVCFLDIRMPGLSGIEVAQRIAATGSGVPVVFVTAFGDHALAAFDAGAIDYVMKPVDAERLAQAVARVKSRLTAPPLPTTDLGHLFAQLAGQASSARRRLDVIQASVGKEVRLIRVQDIVYFESDARYTRVVHDRGDALIRTPLKELLAQLDEQQFWQVHRSVIVNHLHIASAVRIDEGNMHLTLRDRSEKLPVSRQFQGLFKGQ